MWSKTYETEKVLIGRLSFNGDLLEELNSFSNENNIKAGWISIIGAVKTIKLGYYDQKEQKYVFLDHEGLYSDKPFEISSCTGNISVKNDKSIVHLHIVVSDREGKSFGGHVMPGTQVYAGEFMIQVFRGEDLIRTFDSETALPLWSR